MKLNNEAILIIRFASGLGMLQAAAWSIMAIIAIAIFYDQPNMYIDENTSYSRLVSILIYGRFLFNPDDGVTVSNDMVIKGPQFHVFMWFYLVLDLIWLGNSYRLYAETKNPSSYPTKKVTRIFKFWTLNTLIISLLDFIFVCFLGSDYHRCEFNIMNGFNAINGVACHIAGGIVLTLAAKGYFLWFLNIGLAVTIRKIRKNIIMVQERHINNGPNNTMQYPSIPRFPQRTSMQPVQPTSPNPYYQGQQNPGAIGQQPNNGQPEQYPYYGQLGPQNNLVPPPNLRTPNSPTRF